ncbi:type IV toxin-antitoxin system AbiEi family antitoxin [Demequina pelophila]|uniref:type IV toxin-antitoxin system AbiEi family antitoxin n=1 Tax=Demequina pelophila TaxID=1638984 RepID=UPI000AD27EA0|nr:type IV toxin-antitoxin system AbiEi family antitoxin [Demequina pelophila]
MAVPVGADAGWVPHVHEVAILAAAQVFGWDAPYVAGVTAARLHGARIQSIATAHVTVPRQTRRLRLHSPDGTVVFHQRAERVITPMWESEDPWSIDSTPAGPWLDVHEGELCTFRLTSPVQTVLDLMHAPSRLGHATETHEVAWQLVQRIGFDECHAAAGGQRRHRAAHAAMDLRPTVPPPEFWRKLAPRPDVPGSRP